jgi:hypothetical protein
MISFSSLSFLLAVECDPNSWLILPLLILLGYLLERSQR